MKHVKHLRRPISLLMAMILIVSAFCVNGSRGEVKASGGTNTIADFTQEASGDLKKLTGGYSADDRYVVLSAKLKALDAMKTEWASSVVVGVSGLAAYENYAFQFIYAGDGSSTNGIKLNSNSSINFGFGTFDGIEIPQYQGRNQSDLEALFTTGIAIRVVRLNTWTYLLADMGNGYEQIGVMYVPTEAETQLSLCNGNTKVQMTDITVETGKNAAAAAFDDAKLTMESGAARAFSFDEKQWVVDAKLDYRSAEPVFEDNDISNYDSGVKIGEAYSIKTKNLEGRNVQWSVDGTTWSSEQPYFTNPGTYTVYYKCEAAGNMPEVSGSKTLTIRYFLNNLDAIDGVKVTYTDAWNNAKESSGADRFAGNVANGNRRFVAWIPQWTKSNSLRFYAPMKITKEQVAALLKNGATELSVTISQSYMNDSPWWGLTNTVSADWTTATQTVGHTEGNKELKFSLQDFYDHYDEISAGTMSLFKFAITGLAEGDGGVWDGSAWVSSSYDIGIKDIKIIPAVKTTSAKLTMTADNTGNKLIFTSDSYAEDTTNGGHWLRWVRNGEQVTLYGSKDGKTYEQLQTAAADNAAGMFKMSLAGWKTTISKLKIRLSETAAQKGVLKGAQVKLGDSIGIDFHMDLSEDVINDVSAYLEFTLPGVNFTDEKILVSQAKKDTATGYYVFSCGIAAKEMASDIKLQIVSGDTTKGTEYTYKVTDYGNTILTDTTGVYDDSAKAMIKAMLNYGAYAQVHFNCNTENLANAVLEEADKNITMPTLGEAYKSSMTATAEGLNYYGSSLMLTSKTAIRHYFTLADGATITDFTFRYNDQTLTAKEKQGYYYVEITDIVASRLSEFYTLQIQKGGTTVELKYSPYTNIKAITESSSFKDSSKNMMAALYYYAETANAYCQKKK